MTGAGDPGAEHASAARDANCFLQRRDRVWILRADVDVALRRADRDAGDRHAFDEQEGIAFHNHAIGKSGAIAFVGVADDVFLIGGRIVDRLPLDTRGEAGAAATTQAGFGNDVDDTGAAERERLFETDVAAVIAIVVERQRIYNTAARKCKARLPRKEADLLDRADRFWMRRQCGRMTVEKARGDKARDIRHIEWPETVAHAVALDLEQRLQPHHAT